MPRYERVVDFLLNLLLIAGGILPPAYRPPARKLVVGLMTLFFVLAGVVAGTSMDEAITLVTAGVFAAILALLFGVPSARPRHQAQAGPS